jgi:hypothetical protein
MKKLAFCLVVALIMLVLAPALASDWPELELGAVKPLAPDLTLAMGASASLKLFDIPDDFFLFPGRSVFADFLYVDDNGDKNPFLGGSIEAWKKTRLGGAIWHEDGTRWTFYAIQPVLAF